MLLLTKIIACVPFHVAYKTRLVEKVLNEILNIKRTTLLVFATNGGFAWVILWRVGKC
jgi:hypothetical protein